MNPDDLSLSLCFALLIHELSDKIVTKLILCAIKIKTEAAKLFFFGKE